jgi:hypothetical protein
MSPGEANVRTFLANSVIAVAILTTSGLENPTAAASERPVRLAMTMSSAEAIGSWIA